MMYFPGVGDRARRGPTRAVPAVVKATSVPWDSVTGVTARSRVRLGCVLYGVQGRNELVLRARISWCAAVGL